MDKLIDGKKWALEHEQALKEKIKSLGLKLKVVSILAGDDPASLLYSNLKQKKAQEVGIDFELKHFNVPPQGWDIVVEEIRRLNDDESINGIMVQLPLPEDFLEGHSEQELLDQILPGKDVDGLTSKRIVLPAAVKAVLSLLEDEKIEVNGKKVAVLGRSELIGKPVAEEFLKMGAEVLVGHSETPDLSEVTKEADIIVAAMGVPELVKGEMVKEGVIIIDVGTTKVEGKFYGDVDFESVYLKASKITPVPGGVGPMTVVSLMENAVKLVERRET